MRDRVTISLNPPINHPFDPAEQKETMFIMRLFAHSASGVVRQEITDHFCEC